MSKLDNYLAAERARLAGSKAQAIDLYRDALKADPDDDAIRLRLAEVLRETGDLHKGLMELFTGANRLIWQGRYDDARRFLDRMRNWDPEARDAMTQQVPVAMQQIDEAAAAPEEDDEPLLLEDTRSFLLSVVLEESGEFQGDDLAQQGEDAAANRVVASSPVLDAAARNRTPPPGAPRTFPGKRVTLVLDGGQVIDVPSMNFLIGAAADCDLVLKKRGVAPHHARIIERGGLTVVRDCESGRPTIVNGAVVPFAVLTTRDTIALGTDGVRLKVRIDAPPAAPA